MARVPGRTLHGGPGEGRWAPPPARPPGFATCGALAAEPRVRAGSRYLRPAADSAPRVTRRLRPQCLIGQAGVGAGLGRSYSPPTTRGGAPAGEGAVSWVLTTGRPDQVSWAAQNGLRARARTPSSRLGGQEQVRSVTKKFFSL